MSTGGAQAMRPPGARGPSTAEPGGYQPRRRAGHETAGGTQAMTSCLSPRKNGKRETEAADLARTVAYSPAP